MSVHVDDLCWFGNIESGAYLWYFWCDCLSSSNHTSGNSHPAGNFVFLQYSTLLIWSIWELYLLFQRFEAVNLLLAAILLFSSFQVGYSRLFILQFFIFSPRDDQLLGPFSLNVSWLLQLFANEEEDDTDLSDNFVVKTCQKLIPVTGIVQLYSYFFLLFLSLFPSAGVCDLRSAWSFVLFS